jgi:WD40 repeat protein
MYVSVAGVSQALKVFPLNAAPFEIALPFPLGAFAYGPDGYAIYATSLFDPSQPRKQGIFKIEFDPIRVNVIPGSVGFGVDALAVPAREDAIFIAGGRRDQPCGIFELDLNDGHVRTIVQDPGCNPLNPSSHWSELSLSPDEKHAIALRDHHLFMIDLKEGKTASLPDGLILGAWSPDGRWLASIRSGSDETILMDATTLKAKKVIEATDLVWSPDSCYLLATTRHLSCGPEAGTLAMVDVNSGKRLEIRSSNCQIDRNTLGWVGSGVSQ